MEREGRGSVQWADRPPSDARLFVDVVWPKPGRPVRGYCINPDITGAITHWILDRSVGCRGTPARCQGCKENLARVWKGYMPWVNPVLGRIQVALLTEECVRTHARLKSDRPQLRGTLLQLERLGTRRKGRMQATITSDLVHATPVNLPPPVDVAGFLLRLWGFSPEPVELPGEGVAL